MHLSLTKLVASLFATACLAALVPSARALDVAGVKTKNVFLITTDGFRWQDLFTGADPELLNKENGGVANTNQIRKLFWRETPEERREALMPFFWGTIAKQGQVFGNQHKGSIAQVTNGRNFSYPGYNEILTGFANSNITSNAKMPNPNITVFEWLHRQSAYRGKVAAYSAWDVIPSIFNRDRCGFPVMGGWEPVPNKKPSPREQLLNSLIEETTPTVEAEVYDSFLYHAAREHLLRTKPRVMMIGFLETDAWGHSGRYDQVLKSARRVDEYIKQLWTTVQAIPQYRGKTTFIITTDHGRGFAPTEWKSHGASIQGAENMWMAFMGPDTPALGERTDCDRVTQSQIAATLAALLRQDYPAAEPRAGQPIRDVFYH